ncbi:phage baseplate assembly protein V [Roseospira visakhapatnamensis]|uniref:Phage baseplate assembly protein V n=1 Tax=Roseospira visakhapatnamensis TaxID=390880 RepID=A0A7W6RFW2_9PROT|nr:phage baseplate assembly protein V [Roseospira visakhapatnamensis]MBB4267819.1 phage baseplate assembly protein V [Roseospira visakhapatnamensis]
MGRDHDIDTADLHRRAGNMLRVGTIAAVDHDRARVRVAVAGRTSAWLPWPADVGRNFVSWRPLRPGQQVLVAAPSGDPANAVIVQTLYSGALPAPDTDPEADVIRFDDGTTITYRSDDHTLTIDTTRALVLRAAETLRIEAPHVEITGQSLTHNGVNVGADHVHTDVKPGPANTGPPAGA